LGWVPEDFGALAIDDGLVRAIELFQADRVLPVSGVADSRTHSALLAFRKALVESRDDRDRRFNLRSLGSVSRLPADDPRVARSSAFAGSSLYAPSGTNRSLLGRVVRAGRVAFVTVPTVAPDAPAMARVAVGAGVGVALAAASRMGAKAGPISGALPGPPRGLVIEVDAPPGPAYVFALRRAARALRDIRAEMPDVPLAVITPPHRVPRHMRRMERDALAGLKDLADVYMPRVPGFYRGYPVEYWCGQVLAEWSVVMRERGNARWTFPLYEPVPGDANHAMRFRAYMAARGIRGHGFYGLPANARTAPYFGPLPSRVRRVDNDIRWPR
jgi:hypothetical protein